MGMTALLTRIKADHFDFLEVGEQLPEPPLETVDIGKDWESIMYVFGNGSLKDQIVSEIFMPINALGDEEEIRNGGGIRYHTNDSIAAINKMIGDLKDPEIRKIIQPDKMKHLYRFHPEGIDELVKTCLLIINLFDQAEKNGDVVLAGIE